MNSWLKAMVTVLLIVLGSFSMAALATWLDEALRVRRQILPDADSSQELPLSAQTIITN